MSAYKPKSEAVYQSKLDRYTRELRKELLRSNDPDEIMDSITRKRRLLFPCGLPKDPSKLSGVKEEIFYKEKALVRLWVEDMDVKASIEVSREMKTKRPRVYYELGICSVP